MLAGFVLADLTATAGVNGSLVEKEGAEVCVRGACLTLLGSGNI